MGHSYQRSNGTNGILTGDRIIPSAGVEITQQMGSDGLVTVDFNTGDVISTEPIPKISAKGFVVFSWFQGKEFPRIIESVLSEQSVGFFANTERGDGHVRSDVNLNAATVFLRALTVDNMSFNDAVQAANQAYADNPNNVNSTRLADVRQSPPVSAETVLPQPEPKTRAKIRDE